MITQPGRFHAPQFGLPRRDLPRVRELPKQKFTKDHLTELVKLMKEKS